MFPQDNSHQVTSKPTPPVLGSALRRQLTSIKSWLPWLVSLAALTLRLVPELGASTLFSSSWGRWSHVPAAGWGAVQSTGAQGLEGAGEGHTVASHPSTSRSSSSSGGPRRGPRTSSQRSHLVWGHPMGSFLVVSSAWTLGPQGDAVTCLPWFSAPPHTVPRALH